MSSGPDKRHGFLLGKFMPPHAGHVFLCDFARNYCDSLTILVCSLDDEPIPGHLRHAWMSEMFPDCRVLWCAEALPQQPQDHPDFWPIWKDVVSRYAGDVDLVFAGEPYGRQLAETIGATFVPQDRHDGWKAVSGTAVRRDPFGQWAHIPTVVRPHYVRRVCVFGPESTGKSTLAGKLARAFDTICVPEYGRLYTETFGLDLSAGDLLRIADGQRASERAARRQANRIQIEDTDTVLTDVWAQMLLGHKEPGLEDGHDLADLYILCDADVPWVDDGTRYFPLADDRRRFSELCEKELVRRGANFVTVRGGWDQRLEDAQKAILAAFPGLGP